jgi:hypothetical protein
VETIAELLEVLLDPVLHDVGAVPRCSQGGPKTDG